jgi:hypothetical protein
MIEKLDVLVPVILGCIIAGIVITMTGLVASEAWKASEKAAAYAAYVACLNAMKNETIDVKQTFCGRIRDQL